MNKKTPIYIIPTNHFDIVWRRGFKKSFAYNGQTYVGGAVIEDANITEWLEMARNSNSTFEIECSLVLRTYLENHPEALPEFQKLVQEDRFELLACGEVIPDTNMPSGETLVRNLMYGLLWARDTLGVTPSTGNLNDAFGVSSQLPQIFKLCGVDWITGLTYKYPNGEYWRGLDGTIVKITPNMQYEYLGMARYFSGGTYYRPCPACSGNGCAQCNFYGFDPSFRMGEGVDFDFSGLQLEKNGFGVVYIGGEETLATKQLPQKVAEANTPESDCEIKFGLHKHVGAQHFAKAIAHIPRQDEIAPEVEGNPIQTGCYVSRIQTKQQVRRLENKAIAVEKLAALAWKQGHAYPAQDLLSAWREISFGAFHDNITGTHVDVGYEELCERYACCDEHLNACEKQISQQLFTADDNSITVFNPHNVPLDACVTAVIGGEEVEFMATELPPLGLKTYRKNEIQPLRFLEADGLRTAENNAYRLGFDECGIVSIYDKANDKELINRFKGYAGELILEHDFGDPWTTREPDRKRTRLGRMNSLKSVRTSPQGTEIVYQGKFRGNEKLLEDPADYRVLLLEWTQTIKLYAGEEFVRFETDILWDTFDRRIRVSFPTYMTEDEGMYAVPYGTLKRPKYDKENRQGVGVADGDWPAVEWFATSRPQDVNMALINTGTPSCRIELGEMLLSLLRSPTFPSCLFWPRVYNAPVYDGMRDRGTHHFSYAFTSYAGEVAHSGVYQKASLLNCPPLVFQGEGKHGLALPLWHGEGFDVSAVKRAENGKGLVYRLFARTGEGARATMQVDSLIVRALEVNLLEDTIQELAINEGTLTVSLRGFEIKTILLQTKKDS